MRPIESTALSALVTNPDVACAEVAEALDAATPVVRREAVLSLNRRQQRALFAKALGAPAARLDDFVPQDRGPREPVRHAGRNTLPILPRLQFFEKRFCRADHDPKQLFGYNAYVLEKAVGPGYFVAEATFASSDPGQVANDWAARGGVVVDYFRTPVSAVPAGWPKIVPNSQGVQRFVYGGTRDFMRRISAHVTIGAAYKGEAPLDHYFVLVREP